MRLLSPLVFVLALGCAGALGAVTRYAFAEWIAPRWRKHFPLATFFINVTGAFALGLLLTVGSAHTPGLAQVRVVLGTGFLGGYTTFSTLSFETHALARRGRHDTAWLNALGTLLVGIAAVAAGIALGHLL